jgi:hypothetical protein
VGIFWPEYLMQLGQLVTHVKNRTKKIPDWNSLDQATKGYCQLAQIVGAWA